MTGREAMAFSTSAAEGRSSSHSITAQESRQTVIVALCVGRTSAFRACQSPRICLAKFWWCELIESVRRFQSAKLPRSDRTRNCSCDVAGDSLKRRDLLRDIWRACRSCSCESLNGCMSGNPSYTLDTIWWWGRGSTPGGTRECSRGHSISSSRELRR